MTERRSEPAALLAVVQSNSLHRADHSGGRQTFAFTPYGFEWGVPVAHLSLALNGQLPDALTGLYLLGAGHRAYSPVLMRFISVDQASPFGAGGINAFAYCEGDPVNYNDNSGRTRGGNPPPLPRAQWMSRRFVEGGLQNSGRPEARPYRLDQRRHSFNGFDRPASKSIVGYHAAKTEYAQALTGTLSGRKDVLKTPLGQHKRFGVDPYYFKADNEFGAAHYGGELSVAEFYAGKRSVQSQASTTIFTVFVDNAEGLLPGLDYHAGLLKHPAKPPYPETPYFFQFGLLPRVISRVSLQVKSARDTAVQPLRSAEV
ncbi:MULTISPECIES: RHS repeat-associated core domain-containing protein [unclassified Pseudomonas]|jgi:RHS repeat-associated protein|uniref:RHS repeat-associated core domain-containing protein n=1 Tax=Pseudomonas TaxID=286 RepID=UPI000D018E9A|nr:MULTISPECIES: RHS repeat-associated core domain-containing protein [unclassified Pseudomonas]MDR2317959.1 RHS repeat-associated core domain-containing protein [Pseudomonas sp.]PYG77379.1 RHS repeat-associated protein [Pseudomonas sp. RV120224-01c]PYG80810.1 RHS repeat-associated protein [Pseudomonas sp. RV120224-01b]